MILETKQVLFRAHVHSFDRRSRNAHDHFEQTIKVGGCVYQKVFKKQALIIKVIINSNDCFSRIGL